MYICWTFVHLLHITCVYIQHEETLLLATINKQFKVSKRVKRIYTCCHSPMISLNVESDRRSKDNWEFLGNLGRRVFQLLREIGSFHAKGEPDTKVFDARDGYVYTLLRSKEEFVSTMEMNILIGTRLADSSSFIDKVILIITLTPSPPSRLLLSLSLIF